MVVAFAALLAVLALAALGVLVLSALALEPPWLAEARYRAGGVLSEFGDWLRLGR